MRTDIHINKCKNFFKGAAPALKKFAYLHLRILITSAYFLNYIFAVTVKYEDIV